MAKLISFKNIGPGTLVAAAFIGPGTVTVCSKAGSNFGFSLLWALVLSIFATLILQEMSARLGLISKMDLAEAIRSQLKQKWMRTMAVVLIISAIIVGNSAYQAGNISGSVLGLQNFIPQFSYEIGGFNVTIWPIILGGLAFIMLYIGSYKLIERTLVILVVIMSLSFIAAALMTMPNWKQLFAGTFIPTLPNGSLTMIVGLIGTTVVPYNLFLHASLVQEKWTDATDLKKVRKDSLISIVLGGLVSMSIVIAAAAIPTGTIENAGDLAKGLEPLYGKYASGLLGLGLFAAGITSAITAPLAAGYVAQGCFGWEKNIKSTRFRLVWGFVLIVGVIFASLGTKPMEIIQFAQITNGLLLPILALFLIWIVNRKPLMGVYVNTRFQNALALLLIFIVVVLSVKMIYNGFNP